MDVEEIAEHESISTVILHKLAAVCELLLIDIFFGAKMDLLVN